MPSAAKSVCLASRQVLSQSSTACNQLVVLDAGIDDLDVLLSGLKPGSAFHVLDAKQDGIAQISALLRQSPTTKLTLVAHGFPGGLQLGAQTLELNNLHSYQQQLSGWFASESSSTVTLLSCHVASGDAGSEFVSSLSELTGANIQAVATAVGNGQWPSAAMETFESDILSTYTATLELSLNTVFKDGIDGIDALQGATSVTVSGDGKQVFVTSNKDKSLTVFDRDAATQALSVNTVFTDGVGGVDGLDGASSVTVSEDGKQVFVASFVDGALTVFDRNAATGELTFNEVFKDGVGDITALKGAFSVTVSGDGSQVFVASQRDDALTVFDRNAATGKLTLNTVFKDGVGDVNELDGARSVTVSDDGTQVFVASERDDALTVFDRDASTGELTFNTAFKDGVGDIDALDGAFSVTTSQDGKQVFVASRRDHALTVLDRDAVTGELTFKESFKDGVGDVTTLRGANSVTLSDDGTQVFVTSFVDDALTVFDRDAATGDLTLNQSFKDGQSGASELNGAFSVTVSGDGTQVFVSSENDNALTVFDREVTDPEEPVDPEPPMGPGGPTAPGKLTFDKVFKDGVDDIDALKGATSVTLSGDGTQVFVTSNKDKSLTVFDRDSATLELTVNTVFTDGVGGVDGLDGASSVTVSGDGTQVFVASFVDGALTVFDRNTSTGELAFNEVFKDGVGDITSLKGAFSVTESGDGKQVFVASQRDDTLTVFDRNASTGKLTLNTVFKDGVGAVNELDGARSVTVSGDGTQVFVTSERDGALTVFDRDASTGELVFSTVFKDGVGDIDALRGAFSVTTSKDGKQVFVVGRNDDALTVFDRNTSTGELTFNTAFKDGVGDIDALKGASFVTLSDDDTQVFVTSFRDDGLTVFDRDAATGELTLNETFRDNRSDTNDLNGAFSVTVSGDGKQVFVASENDNALTVFDREVSASENAVASSASVASEELASEELIATSLLAPQPDITTAQPRLAFSGRPSFSVTLPSGAATTNLLAGDADTIDLSEQSGPLDVVFTVSRAANFDSTVGLYTTDTVDGNLIDPVTGELIKPGDIGYKEAAIARKLDVQLTGTNGKTSQFTSALEGGSFLSMYLVADGTDASASEVYFSHAGANSNGADHVQQLGNNTFGFEDMAGLGDADFNDIVVQFAVV